MTVPCLLEAWSAHEAELLRYLRHRLRQPAEAEDVLHDLFLRAVRQRERFCAVTNPRAWLFEVARNIVIDNARRAHASEPLPDNLVAFDEAESELAPVDRLSACLPRVLSELAAEDREALECCDIDGMTQQAFAELKGLSLPGAKSRVRRARQRLRAQLLTACQVQLDEDGKVCCFVPRPPLG
ncbi:sigma-70 family RNA polymerase sigma factor [Thauera sp. WH-2]|uniref:sigma-70 family RNA polymerase sigma factor n=1 Tax=unclassified Thauera TaxID=2609274 RepID=UPI00056EA08B|nr:sigma-70 family RNA polymerase sigma factor [Thauera sp. 63]